MQGLIRRVVTEAHHPLRHTNSYHRIFNAHTHNSVFSSIPQPPQPKLHQCNHIPSSFLTHPIRHFHSSRSSSSKVRTFLSQPLISFNSLLRVSARSLLGCRPSLLYFCRNNFDFGHNHHFSPRSWRSWLRGLTANDVVLGLIIANFAIFLLWRKADEEFMIKNFTISLDNFKSGRLHTLITCAFSHIDPGHIVSNMFGLYIFGMSIGKRFGPEFLLKLYLAGAVGGSVFYLIHRAYQVQTSKEGKSMNISRQLALGASGAVNAIMLFDIFLFPKATLYFDFFIPVPAVLLGIFLIGKDMRRILEGDSKISGSAHLGGAAVAAIAWAGVRKGRF